jgi:hypothetical protein
MPATAPGAILGLRAHVCSDRCCLALSMARCSERRGGALRQRAWSPGLPTLTEAVISVLPFVRPRLNTGNTDRLPPWEWRTVLILAVMQVLGLLAVAGRYGYSRDELYFLECGRHLAWGYPDQPPFVPLVARLMSSIAPNSVTVLRLPAIAAAVAEVLLSGLIARRCWGSSLLGSWRRDRGGCSAHRGFMPVSWRRLLCGARIFSGRRPTVGRSWRWLRVTPHRGFGCQKLPLRYANKLMSRT